MKFALFVLWFTSIINQTCKTIYTFDGFHSVLFKWFCVRLTLTMLYVFALLFIFLKWNIIFATKSGEYCVKKNFKMLKCNHIPRDIPFGILTFRLVDFKRYSEMFIMNSTQLQSENWGRLRSFEISYATAESIVTIIFKSGCFKRLKHLRELHIHLSPIFILEDQAFDGLDSLKLLDLTGCVRLSIHALTPSLAGYGKLPQLENLKLARLNFYREPLVINNTFAQAIRDKKIRSLDLSNVNIAHFNVTALVNFNKTLKNVNVSFSTISTLTMDRHITLNYFYNLNVLDTCQLSCIRIIPPSRMFNQVWNTSKFNTWWYHVVAPKVLNISRWLVYPFSIWIKNSTLNIDSPVTFKSEIYIGRENNLKYLDLRIHCNGLSAITLKHIDIAGNGLEFLHPSLLSCSPNLQHLDLSNNQLFKMYLTNRKLFQQLLTFVPSLKVIKFSSNFIKYIPRDIFIMNDELEEIDLSHNELDQVTFALHQLGKLRVLNLCDNKIKILTESSIHTLNSVSAKSPYFRSKKTTILIENNPISCSECKAKGFLQWLTSTKTIDVLTRNTTCVDEKGSTRKINEETLGLVLDICQKRLIIIFTTVAIAITASLLMLVAVITYKCRKFALKKVNKITFLRKLQEGNGEFEFVSFLSHSSDDKTFVEEYLVNQLNENLKLRTGVNRNLVCTDDSFRPGFRILDEISNCIERTLVFVVVVSDNFCESMYCQLETEMAFRLGKPIVIMFKGQVNEDLMDPLLKMLFKSTVRVLWTIKDNKYVMNTTWEKVCDSLVDLVVENVK